MSVYIYIYMYVYVFVVLTYGLLRVDTIDNRTTTIRNCDRGFRGGPPAGGFSSKGGAVGGGCSGWG